MRTASPLLLGRYELGPPLRWPGTNGRYLAYDLPDREVVVAFLPSSWNAVVLGRLWRLRHPHLLAIESWGDVSNRTFVVFEPPPTQTLGDLVREAGLDDGGVRHLAIEVLSALGAVHRLGLTAGDLTPDLVLIADDGSAVLDVLRLEISDDPSRSPRDDLRAAAGVLSDALASARRGAGNEKADELDSVLTRARSESDGFRSAADMLRALAGEPIQRPAVPPPPTAATPLSAVERAYPAVRLPSRRTGALVGAAIAVLAIIALLASREGVRRPFGPATPNTTSVSAEVTTPTTVAPPPAP